MILLLACAARSTPSPPPIPPPEVVPAEVVEAEAVEEPPRVVITRSTPSIVEYPHFVPGTATLVEGQDVLLGEIIKVMAEHPEVRLVEIGGHADPSEGDDAFLHVLSQQRAEAMMAMLVAGGIAAERLTTQNYGESQPMAPGESPEVNARVTLSILERD